MPTTNFPSIEAAHAAIAAALADAQERTGVAMKIVSIIMMVRIDDGTFDASAVFVPA